MLDMCARRAISASSLQTCHNWNLLRSKREIQMLKKIQQVGIFFGAEVDSLAERRNASLQKSKKSINLGKLLIGWYKN